MDKRIITHVDSNLISFSKGEINDENILKNELLIKELGHSCKNNMIYMPADEIKALDEYKVLKKQVEEVTKELEVNNLNEIIELVDYLVEINEKLKSKYETEKQMMLNENTLLKKDKERFIRKYEGQKQRKVVRLVDKVTGK